MTVTVEEVRNVLNMPDPNKFSIAVIEINIRSAERIINAMVRGGTDGEIVDEAKLRLASYLSYLSYSDHIVHDLEGEYSEEDGGFDPVVAAELKEIRDKLKELKDASDQAINVMMSPIGSGKAPMFGVMRLV